MVTTIPIPFVWVENRVNDQLNQACRLDFMVTVSRFVGTSCHVKIMGAVSGTVVLHKHLFPLVWTNDKKPEASSGYLNSINATSS